MLLKRGYLAPFLNSIRLPRRLVNIASIVSATLVLFVLLFFALSGTGLSATVHAAGIHTLDPSTSRLQAPPNCVEQILNGGFEQTGMGGRAEAGASLFSYATDQFAGGRRSLLLGFTSPLNITATFGIEQFLLLPADSTSIAFSFSYQIQVEGGSDPLDQAYLTIYDAANNQLLAMLVLSPTSGGWSAGRYDLTPLAGK